MADLRERIAAEEENINQTLNDLQSALARPGRTIIERAALATFLHNIYSGLENVLKQIWVFFLSTNILLPKSTTATDIHQH